MKFLPLIEDGALVAGGMSHLFVLAPSANVIQRWSLTTVSVILTVSDAGAKEMFHTFKLLVKDK